MGIIISTFFNPPQKKINIVKRKEHKPQIDYLDNQVVIGLAIKSQEESPLLNSINNENNLKEINCPEEDITNLFIWISLETYDKNFRIYQEENGYYLK